MRTRLGYGELRDSAYRVLLVLSLVVGVSQFGLAQGKVIDDGPQSLSQVSSIGEALRHSGPRPLHILYVHGIGAKGAGDSRAFQRGVCALLKDCTAPDLPVERDYADGGLFAPNAEPPTFEYLGRRVWKSQQEWSASTPFVDHYVLPRTDGGPIVIDEINWRPLVFPVKCQYIMTGEARLAGPDPTLIDLCSQAEEKDPSHLGRFKAYTWTSAEEARTMESIRPKGALANRWLKNNTLDWGFSDAIMAVGSMHDFFREGMRQLLLKSARFHADGSKTNDWNENPTDPNRVDREFIVVSHSLGSYLVFSTLNIDRQNVTPQDAPARGMSNTEEDAAVEYIFEHTSLVHFFANQVPLLELAGIGGTSPTELGQVNGTTGTPTTAILSSQMVKWQGLRQNFARRPNGVEDVAAKPQVIAWSDPSDLLSWRVPAIDGLVIVNLYVRNTAWRWLIANPARVHDNYAVNKAVLRIMLDTPAVDAKDGAGTF